MKELQQYQCELCGTVYSSKLKAEMCEENHKTIKKVASQRYLPKNSYQSGYPVTVTILMSDGKEITYKR